MSKETNNVDLKQEAQATMEVMVEQHNTLVSELAKVQDELAKVKQELIEHQGYMRGLEASTKQEEEK